MRIQPYREKAIGNIKDRRNQTHNNYHAKKMMIINKMKNNKIIILKKTKMK